MRLQSNFKGLKGGGLIDLKGKGVVDGGSHVIKGAAAILLKLVRIDGLVSRSLLDDLRFRDGSYRCRRSARYEGARPFSALYVKLSTLKSILNSTGNQCICQFFVLEVWLVAHSNNLTLMTVKSAPPSCIPPALYPFFILLILYSRKFAALQIEDMRLFRLRSESNMTPRFLASLLGMIISGPTEMAVAMSSCSHILSS